MRGWLLFLPLLALAVAEPAVASVRGAVLHEPIPPDPREDLLMHVTLDGDLPAALQTPSGIVAAPDPRAPLLDQGAAYGSTAERSTFQPDRDTQRPEILTYDEPFTPSTAPFKRLEAFDAVREDYQLYVRDTRLVPLANAAPPGMDDDAFFADLVVELAPDHRARIPSVGPGARLVRARLGDGVDALAFHVLRDGADNWWLQATGLRGPKRARFVMELAIPRTVFGGPMGDPAWNDLPIVPPLPDNVARDAAEVRAAIGVSRALRPREAITKLVQYFRGFSDSDEPPRIRRSVYLDLALSKKGVCRHRAFAFLVTAQSLGIPTRLIQNEAHAWVEVHDGTLWRRIDLGGAGRMPNPASDELAERTVYQPPPDVFAWPQNSERGDDMVADARSRAASNAGAPSSAASGGKAVSTPSTSSSRESDDRPASTVTVGTSESDAHRGRAVTLHGQVRAEGEACAHVAVDVSLRDRTTQRTFVLGTLATGEDGVFEGAIVVPGSMPLGHYDVIAQTPGDTRCGSGSSN